jgi:hypothetical protein
MALKLNRHAYHAESGYGKVYKAIERLADEWMERHIERILNKGNNVLDSPKCGILWV